MHRDNSNVQARYDLLTGVGLDGAVGEDEGTYWMKDSLVDVVMLVSGSVTFTILIKLGFVKLLRFLFVDSVHRWRVDVSFP